MQYTLLTGATGLLGAYLLRDGMKAGRRFVVLVRAGKCETAAERIESLLARFETEAGEPPLPRPVVLEGDLTAPGLGLDADARAWLRRHCNAVLHNAASLSFRTDEQTGEPRRTNVEGVRNVLDLTREIGVRTFYHVSTAYVCGLRHDVCREDELDVGQTFGNAYEETKVEGEKLVRSADFLDSLTVFRPSIVVGDSRTGYTSTYHGFYTPLKVLSPFVVPGMPLGKSLVDTLSFLDVLGLQGTERKHFVPLDWVSEVTTFLMSRPEYAGRTYHLTPAQPVPVSEMQQVFVESLSEHFRLDVRADAPLPKELAAFGLDNLQKAFRNQMIVYEFYWRNDPTFDASNTLQAAPHLPCPTMTRELLVRMALFALRTKFGWPRPRAIKAEFDAGRFLAESNGGTKGPAAGPAEPSRLGLAVSGRGGGDWSLTWQNGRGAVLEPGLPGNGDTTLFCNSETLRRIVDGRMTLPDAVRQNALHVECEGNVPDWKLIEAAAGRLTP